MTINYKTAGYTHQLKYERQHPDYGWVEGSLYERQYPDYGWVEGSFHVVPDSYDVHLNALQKDKKVRNIQIVEL